MGGVYNPIMGFCKLGTNFAGQKNISQYMNMVHLMGLHGGSLCNVRGGV